MHVHQISEGVISERAGGREHVRAASLSRCPGEPAEQAADHREGGSPGVQQAVGRTAFSEAGGFPGSLAGIQAVQRVVTWWFKIPVRFSAIPFLFEEVSGKTTAPGWGCLQK